MSFLLGIDGGGSKTTALLAASDGRILGRGLAGSSNFQAAGLQAACQALDEAMRAAFQAAGIPTDPARVRRACFGLAGVGRPGDQAGLQAWLAQRWPGMPARFVNDAHLVLAAGTPHAQGLAVICGTGSIAYGLDRLGQVQRAGGWGYLLGDEGSGYAQGLAALRRVVRAADGRAAPTRLTGLILSAWSLSTPADLVRAVYTTPLPRQQIAALAGLVEQAAAGGDPAAQAILDEAAAELALAAQAVLQRLDFGEMAVPCALAGGALAGGRLLAPAFLAAAQRLGLRLEPVQIVTEPALGAVKLAMEMGAGQE